MYHYGQPVHVRVSACYASTIGGAASRCPSQRSSRSKPSSTSRDCYGLAGEKSSTACWTGGQGFHNLLAYPRLLAEAQLPPFSGIEGLAYRLQDLKKEVANAIKEAEVTCADGKVTECAAAWDTVSRTSARLHGGVFVVQHNGL